MGILAAFAIGDLIQINEEIAPGMIRTDAVEPGDADYLAAVAMATAFAAGEAQPHYEFADAPPRPSPHHVWQGGAWVDPRTAEEIDDDMQMLRMVASLTKAQFIEACMSVNILTPDEAIIAARMIPPSFEPIIAALPPLEQTIARIQWPTVTIIDRLNPLILAIAAGAGISEATLDALFGLTEYAPL